MSKILITGGAGFVGSHLADRLIARGDEVLVIDNYATGRRDNLTAGDRLEIVEGTIADSQLVDEVFARFSPDVVVHAAAAYKDPEAWIEDAETNVIGGINIARATQRLDGARLIYFQTALCYGLKPEAQPIPIDYRIDSKGSSYAISKSAAEHYIELSGIDFISFRLANAYGPRNISGPLPTFFSRLTAGKPCFVMDTRRDFIYIDDLIDVVVKAVDGHGNRGYYHVSSGGDFSIKELFDATIEALGISLDEPVEVRPRGEDDAFTILLDPAKTNADFDWSISTPLSEGVGRAIDYYREFGIEETFTHLKMPSEPAKA